MRVKANEAVLALGFLGLMITLYLAFNWAPSVNINAFESPESQRIFYWHVPAAWAAFIAFAVCYLLALRCGFSNEVLLVGNYILLVPKRVLLVD